MFSYVPRKLASIVASFGLLAAPFMFATGIIGVAPAAAQVETCPANWSNVQQAPGYQQCRANFGVISFHAVQIVDLKRGARVVIGSQISSDAGTPYAKFVTRTADDWWNYMLNYTTSPTGGQLQAVTNASFFMDPDSSVTRLSFAQKRNGVVETSGQGCYFTVATGQDCSRPDQWGKRKFGLYSGGAKALIRDYPYNGWSMTTTTTNLSDVSTGIVGYGPNSGPTTDNSRRTYVGGRDTDGDGELDRLYILTTVDEISQQAAINVLAGEFRTSANIQLDGGGSTQLKSRAYSFGSKGCAVPFVGCRRVPNVLAVYAAAN